MSRREMRLGPSTSSSAGRDLDSGGLAGLGDVEGAEKGGAKGSLDVALGL